MSSQDSSQEEIPKESFEAYYAREIVPEIPDLEVLRKEAMGKMALPMTIVIGLVGALFVMNPILGLESLIIVIIGAVSLYGLYRRYKNSVTREYRMEFKQKVIRKIVKYIDPKHRYSPYGKLSKSEFDQSDMFLFSPDRYRGDDLVSGINDQTSFSFSEIYAQHYVRDHRRRRHLVPLFKGILFKADFNKNFNSRTLVLADISERFLGSFGEFVQKLNITRDEIVRLENPDFEKVFSVYSPDQIEARYILSPKLMERILTYSEKHKLPISLSFSNSSVYIAIPRIKDLFEPEVFKTIDNEELMHSYYEDMKLAIDIIDELDLNTRIWSKLPKQDEPKPKSVGKKGRRGYRGRWR